MTHLADHTLLLPAAAGDLHHLHLLLDLLTNILTDPLHLLVNLLDP